MSKQKTKTMQPSQLKLENMRSKINRLSETQDDVLDYIAMWFKVEIDFTVRYSNSDRVDI